jgi:Flp pilus assembly protein TadG
MSRRRTHRLQRRFPRFWRSGQSATELAVAIPILVVLLLAGTDFGRLFYSYTAVKNAARAGAQYGSQSVITAADSSGVVAAANTDGANVTGLTVTASQCTCVSSPSSVPACAGNYCNVNKGATYVIVNTQAPFHTIVNYPGIPSSLNAHRAGRDAGSGMKTQANSIRLKNERVPYGQSMAEFAIVAALLFLITFAIMEVGWAVYQYNTVSSAARDAVRYAVVHSPTSANPATTSQIQQVAVNAAPNLGLATSAITVSWPADTNLPSKKDAEVQISYEYQLNVPFMSPTTLTFTTTSRMLVSQ